LENALSYSLQIVLLLVKQFLLILRPLWRIVNDGASEKNLMAHNIMKLYLFWFPRISLFLNGAILVGVIIWVAVIIPVDVAISAPAQIPRPELSGQVYVIGHRGAAGLAPENTLAAFSRACDIGVDAIELDVMLTLDRQVVIHHDFALKPEIARAPDGRWIPEQSRPVLKDRPLSELKTYDVGRLKTGTRYARRYPDQQPVDGERIPTLKELLDLHKSQCSPDTGLWIEIKTSPEEPRRSSDPIMAADAVLDIVRAANYTDRVWIQSFDWRALVHVQKMAPQIPTVYLSLVGIKLNNIRPGQPGPSPWLAGFDVDDFGGSIPRTVQAAGGRVWAPYYRHVTRRNIDLAHQLGLQVFVWTPDKRSDMILLMEMGVDGIITNRPDILQSIIKAP